MKNFTLILLLFITVVSCKKELKKETHLIDFVPNNPTAIIHASSIDNLQNILVENDFLKSYKNTKTYKKVAADFGFLKDINSNNELLISHATIGKNLSYLFAIPQKGTTNTMEFKSENLQYNGVSYHELKHQDAYSVKLDSVLVVASSKILIENLIRNQKDNIKYSNPSMLKLYQTISSDITFFINAEKTPDFITSVFPTSFLSTKNWWSFEVNSKSGIAINGIATDNTVAHDFITKLQQSDTEKSNAHEIIPQNCMVFTSYNFDEIKKMSSPFENFTELIDATTEVVSFQVSDESLCAFKVLNTTISGNLQEISTYRNVQLYQNSYYKIPTEISKKQPEYVCFLNDFMIMANTTAALQNCIAHYQNKTTLVHQSYYEQNANGLLRSSHVIKGMQTKTVIQQLAKSLEDVTLLKVSTEKHPLLVHQFTYEDARIQFNSVLQKVSKTKKEASVSQIANVVLDSEIALQPQWVTNHKTKEKEVVVQDVNNILYLISNTGKLVWKKQLEGKIQGAIQQIDLYKNRKLQLAFTTDSEFVVLDRNGKKVAPFYQKFKDGGLLSLAIFDYDKSRDYRFVITQDDEVFMFDNKMKRVNGFKFKKTKSTILQSPKHMRVGTKDYIVVAETNGKLHVLNRQGKSRTEVTQEFEWSNNSLSFTENTIVFADAKNNVQQVNVVSGLVKKIDLLQNKESHYVIRNKIKVKLEDRNLTIRSKTIELDYGTYTQPIIHFEKNAYYISLADLDTQKVFVYTSNGDLLPNFPIYGKSQIALTNADRDKYLEFVVQGEDHALLIYEVK